MANTIVKAAVKEHLADQNVSSDFYDALDDEVSDLLEDAAQRAEDNDRKTSRHAISEATTSSRLVRDRSEE